MLEVDCVELQDVVVRVVERAQPGEREEQVARRQNLCAHAPNQPQRAAPNLHPTLRVPSSNDAGTRPWGASCSMSHSFWRVGYAARCGERGFALRQTRLQGGGGWAGWGWRSAWYLNELVVDRDERDDGEGEGRHVPQPDHDVEHARDRFGVEDLEHLLKVHHAAL